MFKNLNKDFVYIDHNFKGQISKLFSLSEEELRFLPQTSNHFKKILGKSKKIGTINFIKEKVNFAFELYTYANMPLILDRSCETSYLILRSIDIV